MCYLIYLKTLQYLSVNNRLNKSVNRGVNNGLNSGLRRRLPTGQFSPRFTPPLQQGEVDPVDVLGPGRVSPEVNHDALSGEPGQPVVDQPRADARRCGDLCHRGTEVGAVLRETPENQPRAWRHGIGLLGEADVASA